MIKSLNSPMLSSAKPRCGLQSVADLLPRLIRQYEIQAELRNGQNFAPIRGAVPLGMDSSATANGSPDRHQATFAWYE